MILGNRVLSISSNTGMELDQQYGDLAQKENAIYSFVFITTSESEWKPFHDTKNQVYLLKFFRRVWTPPPPDPTPPPTPPLDPRMSNHS